MNTYEVSFKDGRFIESVTVDAIDREEAQELAGEHWEREGVAHGDLTIHQRQPLPFLPY